MVKRRIRVNPDRSPFSIMKNKFSEKTQSEDSENTIDNINDTLERMQKISEDYENEEKIDQLLKMMYLDDVDAEFVTRKMGISNNELDSLVNELIQRGLLHYTNDDVVELTNDGIFHVVTQNSDLFEQ